MGKHGDTFARVPAKILPLLAPLSGRCDRGSRTGPHFGPKSTVADIDFRFAISDIAVRSIEPYIGLGKELAMTTHVLQFVELSDQDRKAARAFDKLGKGDQVEVRVRRKSGEDQVVRLPPKAAALLETALGHLLQGERVAVLAEDQELSPNDAADILGISRPLVVHRMDIGDLPFRYVGKHRRTKLKDVLALKSLIDAQQAAMEALAEDAEDLRRRHGV